MKRTFTLAAAFAIAAGLNAQTETENTKKAINVDKTMVFYLTNDTKTTKVEEVFDEMEGTIITEERPCYWQDALAVDAFNKCGIPLGGTSSTEVQTKINTRKDYVDPKTGFNMPAGSYRGVFIDNILSLQGAVGSDNIIGYSNVKSMVLYFIPIPTTRDNITEGRNIALLDYPTGRVQAKYVDTEGKQVTNEGYREIHINMIADPNYSVENPGTPVEKYHDIRTTNLLNFTRDANDIMNITVDQPYKIEVNLQNKLNGTDYNSLFQADNKRSEYADFICDDNSVEGEMSYYFSDVTENRPFADNPDNFKTCATGYDCVAQKWCTKIDWTPKTIIALAVKKRMYLVGMAIVSATDGSGSKFMNAADLTNAKWSDSAVAYGEHGTSGISNVQTADRTAAKGVFNLAGQRVGNDYKGVVIENGVKKVRR